tara:strand:+ start:197 stop:568 length:372 start_codon:yes stop_codon:yes gene_type:complete
MRKHKINDDIEIVELGEEERIRMIEEFLVKKRAMEELLPKTESTEKAKPDVRPRLYDWGRGRPRKHFNKTVTMVHRPDGTLVRAGRGRPGDNESRIKVKVSHDFKVQPRIVYKLVDDKLEKLA